MSNFVRKFIAVLFAIWLPIFGGAALAASVSMQMPNGACHETGMETMQGMDESQHIMSNDQSSARDQHGTSCAACGVCHFACSAYLGVQQINSMEVLQSAASITPYLFSFHSIISTPLVPPPLA
jgi:hypothetical protein